MLLCWTHNPSPNPFPTREGGFDSSGHGVVANDTTLKNLKQLKKSKKIPTIGEESRKNTP